MENARKPKQEKPKSQKERQRNRKNLEAAKPEKQNNAKAEAEKPSQQAGRVKKPKNKPKQKNMEEVFFLRYNVVSGTTQNQARRDSESRRTRGSTVPQPFV